MVANPAKTLSISIVVAYALVGCLAAALSAYFQFVTTLSVFDSFGIAVVLTATFEGFKLASHFYDSSRSTAERLYLNLALGPVVRLAALIISVFSTIYLCSTSLNLPNAESVRVADYEAAQEIYSQKLSLATARNERLLASLEKVMVTELGLINEGQKVELARWDQQLISETDNKINGTFIGERYQSFDARRLEVVQRNADNKRLLVERYNEELKATELEFQNLSNLLAEEHAEIIAGIRGDTYNDDRRSQHQKLLAFTSSLHNVTAMLLSPLQVGWGVSIFVGVFLESVVYLAFSHLAQQVGLIVRNYKEIQEEISLSGFEAAKEARRTSGKYAAAGTTAKHAMEQIFNSVNALAKINLTR